MATFNFRWESRGKEIPTYKGLTCLFMRVGKSGWWVVESIPLKPALTLAGRKLQAEQSAARVLDIVEDAMSKERLTFVQGGE